MLPDSLFSVIGCSLSEFPGRNAALLFEQPVEGMDIPESGLITDFRDGEVLRHEKPLGLFHT